MRGLVEAGALGEKSGAGFFRREGGEILASTSRPGEYRPRRRVASAAVELARSEPDLRAPPRDCSIAAEDSAGEFLRRALAANLDYAARVGPEIADGVADVDAAMRWGFGWELGPFQTLDALGADAARLLPRCACRRRRTRTAPRGASRPARSVPLPASSEPDLDAARAAARSAQLPSNAAASRGGAAATASSGWSCTASST